MRHLTRDEKQAIAGIVEEAGAVEVIRLLATLVRVGSDHDSGDDIGGDLYRAARALQGRAMMAAPPEPR